MTTIFLQVNTALLDFNYDSIVGYLDFPVFHYNNALVNTFIATDFSQL